MKINRIAIVTMVLVIGFFPWQSIWQSFNEIYFLKLTSTSITKGFIFSLRQNNSIEGGLTYHYKTRYVAGSKMIEKTFIIPSDSLNVRLGDSVLVFYSVKKPTISLLEGQKFNWMRIVFTLLAMLILILLFAKSFRDMYLHIDK